MFLGMAIALIGMAVVGFNWKTIPSHQKEKLEAALRKIGHDMLVKSNDFSSLVMPVRNLGDQKYEVYFQNPITIHPEDLYTITQKALVNSKLAANYIVEVRDCIQQEVMYSYHVQNEGKGNPEIACLGRNLSKGCYTIQVVLLDADVSSSEIPQVFLLMCGVLLIVFIATPPLLGKLKNNSKEDNHSDQIVTIGKYRFFKEEHKLMIDNENIELTSKEYELLTILSNHQNEVVTKDRLLKEIWEDKGVFVGRSLDMFISKLRKKLLKDDAVKIVNVRGVGYKLVVTKE